MYNINTLTDINIKKLNRRKAYIGSSLYIYAKRDEDQWDNNWRSTVIGRKEAKIEITRGRYIL